MFGRKRKPQRTLRLWAADGAPLYDGPLQGFALPEAATLRLSVEFFDDPEPCHIHRSAVHNRVCLELCEACEGKGRVALAALPEGLRACFGAYPGSDAVEVIEG